MSVPELPSPRLFPEVLNASSQSDGLRSLGAAAYTLFFAPEHEQLHVDVARATEANPQLPLHPPQDETVSQVLDKVLPLADMASIPTADRPTLTRLSGVLIQFADYVPRLHNIETPYSRVADLRQAVQDRATDIGPLNLADQLGVALQQTDGNMTDALWQLFITSRLHARWLDSSIVGGMPDFTRYEKVELMKTWHDSVAAFKERQDGLTQDASGDTYYAWTHALAKVTLKLTPPRRSPTAQAATIVFHHGTKLMHGVVHTIAHTQSVKSDHTIAAAYGNTLGEACVDVVRQAAEDKMMQAPEPA